MEIFLAAEKVHAQRALEIGIVDVVTGAMSGGEIVEGSLIPESLIAPTGVGPSWRPLWVGWGDRRGRIAMI